MVHFFARLVLAPSLLLSLCFLAGCESNGHFTLFGYTTQPPFDPNIRTIYVPTAQNVSYLKDVEFDLTQAVIRDIGYLSPYKVTKCRDRADTELLLKVVNRRKNVILQNQIGETRDAEIGLYIEVVWKDLRPGHVGDILSNPKRYDPNEQPLPGELAAKAPKAVPIMITPTATYVPELGGSTAVAQKQAVDRASAAIVHMMEVWR